MKKLILLFFFLSLCRTSKINNELSRYENGRNQNSHFFGKFQPVTHESEYPSIEEHGPDPELTTESLESNNKLKRKKRQRNLSKNEKLLMKATDEALAIYKQQTGDVKARNVPWHKLLKKYLPEPFRSLEKIDRNVIARNELFNYPEFMNNIRFVEVNTGPEPLTSTETASGLEPIKSVDYQHIYDPETGDFNSDFIDSITEDVFNSVEADISFDPNVNNYFDVPSDEFGSQSYDTDKILETFDETFYDTLGDLQVNDANDSVEKTSKNSCKTNANKLKEAEAYAKVLKIYRQQTGKSNAVRVLWDELIKDDLPEKYKNKKINFNAFFRERLYEDPEFMNNLKFPKFYSKRLNPKRRFTKSTNPAAIYDSTFVFGRDFKDKMLLRFREESGWLDAKKINWGLVNREELPVELAQFYFDNKWLEENLLQNNFDLVNKVHFWRYTGNELAKKNYAVKLKDSNLDLGVIRAKVLQIYKEKTGRENAKCTKWQYLVPEKLPAPYNRMTDINSKTFYERKLYEIPEVMQNLHFEIKDHEDANNKNIFDSDSEESEDSEFETDEQTSKRRKRF